MKNILLGLSFIAASGSLTASYLETLGNQISQKYTNYALPAFHKFNQTLEIYGNTMQPGMGWFVQKAVKNYCSLLAVVGATTAKYAYQCYSDALATAAHYTIPIEARKQKNYVALQMKRLQNILNANGEQVLSFEHTIADGYHVKIQGDDFPAKRADRQFEIVVTQPNTDPEFSAHKVKKTVYTLIAHYKPLEYCTYH